MDVPDLEHAPRVSRAQVVFGLVVMLVGILLLMDRLNWWGLRLNVPLWPWVLVVLGLVRLTDRSEDGKGCRRHSRSGVWLLFIGVWGLLNEYRFFGLYYGHSWPLLMIGAGAMVVWRSLEPRREGKAPHEPEPASPNHG